MDAFTLIVLIALGLCVLMHVFGHGHGHARGDTGGRDHQASRPGGAADHGDHGKASDGESRRGRGTATMGGHRHGGGGCH